MTDMAAALVNESGTPVEFTAQDRCDRCLAQARLRLEHLEHGTLEFCYHHGNELQKSLETQGWLVTADTRDELHAPKAPVYS